MQFDLGFGVGIIFGASRLIRPKALTLSSVVHMPSACESYYIGKGPGFKFYDLIKLALVEYENGVVSGGGGGYKN